MGHAKPTVGIWQFKAGWRARDRPRLGDCANVVGMQAGDLADMVIKLAVERVAGVFHTTNQGAVSWYEFARSIFEIAGHDPDRVLPISTAELQPPRPGKRPANSVLDNFAWRHHGFTPSRHYVEALTEVVRDLESS